MISRPLSSPKGRSVLSSKSINVKNQGISKKNHVRISPKKNNPELEQVLCSSPIRSDSTSPIKSLVEFHANSNFSFFEESEEDRAAILTKHISLRRSAIHDENSFENNQENHHVKVDKENETVYGSQYLPAERNPLQDLSIEEFPGTVQFRDSTIEQPLNLHINHKTQLPAYVTPPRNEKLRDFFSSSRLSKTSEGYRLLSTKGSCTTDDIPTDKVIRKLTFTICEDV